MPYLAFDDSREVAFSVSENSVGSVAEGKATDVAFKPVADGTTDEDSDVKGAAYANEDEYIVAGDSFDVMKSPKFSIFIPGLNTVHEPCEGK